MKKYSIALLASLISFAACAENSELIIVSDPWCPFSCEQEAKNQGLAVDLAKAAFEPLGYKVKYVIVPWQRALDQIKTGSALMVSTVDKMVDANPDVHSTYIANKTPLATSGPAYFVKSDSTFVYNDKDVNSLKGKVIGAIGGDTLKGTFKGAFGEYVDQNENNPAIVKKVFGNDAHTQLIDMLIAGRIDLYVDDKTVSEYIINKLNHRDEVKTGATVNDPMDEFLGFSKAAPESEKLVKLFDQRLEELKKDGSFANILQTYGITSK